jgi:hypothetical protein
VVAVTPAPQHAHRVHRGDQETTHEVRRNQHVRRLPGMDSLKITLMGSTSTTFPFESRVNPVGAFIHALAATTEMLPKIPQ